MHGTDSLATCRTERQDADRRRSQLIEAAISAIAEQGLSKITLSDVAGRAGLTAAMVNFHFDSKQALLLAVLAHLAQEYRAAMQATLDAAKGDPARALEGVIRRHFGDDLAEPRKVAVWYAFWGESQARADYLRICDGSDREQLAVVESLVVELCRRAGTKLDAPVLALGLNGLMEGLWQSILREPAFDREASIALCRRYLASLFPAEFPPAPAKNKGDPAKSKPAGAPALDPARRTLPATTYCSAEFYAKEIERIHLGAWQFIGHHSELPEPGSYVAAEILGRRVFAMRGEDGAIRAFHNVCPHRAHAVVTGHEGRCESAIRCPYHAWTFELDGRLKAPAYPKTFPKLDRAEFSLKPLETEIFMGLIFVRFRPGGPSLASQLAPHDSLLQPHRIAEMVPCRPAWFNVVAADWKNVMDNYLECYHCPIGHPGLSCLMEAEYENLPDDATRSALFYHDMREAPRKGWSQHHYNKLLPDILHLPQSQRRRWSYLFAYPGLTLNIYPEQFSVMVVRPLGAGRTWVGGRNYGLRDESRELKAARYLNTRINSQVQREDVSLVSSVQRGLESGAYHTGVFSNREVGVSAFHRWVREDMPEANATLSR